MLNKRSLVRQLLRMHGEICDQLKLAATCQDPQKCLALKAILEREMRERSYSRWEQLEAIFGPIPRCVRKARR